MKSWQAAAEHRTTKAGKKIVLVHVGSSKVCERVGKTRKEIIDV